MIMIMTMRVVYAWLGIHVAIIIVAGVLRITGGLFILAEMVTFLIGEFIFVTDNFFLILGQIIELLLCSLSVSLIGYSGFLVLVFFRAVLLIQPSSAF
jgi:hypothetical protein